MSAPKNTDGLEAFLDVEERDSQKIARGNLRKLAREILKHPFPFYGGCLFIVLGTVATIYEPRLFGYAIDDAIVPKRWDLLVKLTVLYFGVVTLRIISLIGQAYIFEVLGQRVTQSLRVQLFSHLLRLPLSVYDKTPAGRLLTRVTNDISSLNEMFSAGFVSLISNFLIVSGILVALLVMDLRLGLIAASVFPVMALFSAYFSQKLKVAYREARSKLSALNAFLAENLMGMKVVHLFNREKLHLERFDLVNEWYTEALINTVRVFALFQPTITLAAGISLGLVMWSGSLATLSGTMKIGVLFAFFSYVMAVFQPIREMADKWNVFLSGMASAERIFSVLDWPTEIDPLKLGISESAHVKPLAHLKGHIVFENVWFAYTDEHWVLRDFSVEIKAGMQVGIVGHTGAGKTTLISLLMRFYEPQKGRILLDGVDLREYDKRALRATIGIIQQDVFLFSGSYRDNIELWGSKKDLEAEAGSGAVLDVLSTMGYGHWMGSSPRGNEILQERGSNLSMGEKQVMAFARALAAKPAIWILDEATANMDSGTEVLLQNSFQKASQGKTSLLIAHRLATVRGSDLTLVLHKGVLVEKGNHDELLKLNGLYARLYRFQEAQRAIAREAERLSQKV